MSAPRAAPGAPPGRAPPAPAAGPAPPGPAPPPGPGGTREGREGGLAFSFAEAPSVERIRETLHDLRRLVDKFYPRQTPTQRIGHEFSSDALAIVGRLGRGTGAGAAGGAGPGGRASEASRRAAELWESEFPPGTPLGLTPLEAERLIAARRAQVAALDDEITLLQRRLNRLRTLDVRLC